MAKVLTTFAGWSASKVIVSNSNVGKCDLVTSLALTAAAVDTLSTTQSATAPVLASAGTIAVTSVGTSRVAPAGAVTGVILAVGTVPGQILTVINESSAVNTVTFAAAGTSNVADGVSSVIAGLRAARFVWDSGTSLWYRS